MPAAARRHLLAAEALNTTRYDVAGYLYGIAAECAIKAMMLDAGYRPNEKFKTRDDPFFEHFPKLKTMLKDTLKGRRGSPLFRHIEQAEFMNNWSNKMRYCRGNEVNVSWVREWAQQAKQAVADIGT